MLHKLQNEFKKYIETGIASEDLIDQIKGSELDAEEKLSIYKNNIRENLTGSLRVSYPLTEKLIGDQFFEYIASKYVFKNLPDSGCLLNYGRTFSDFLNAAEELNNYKFVPEFAKLEWKINDVHNEVEDQPLTASDLQAMIDQGKMPILRVRKCIRTIASKYNIDELWDVLKNDKEVKDYFKIESEIALYFLVVKFDYETEFFPLEKKEFKVINRILSGEDIEKSLDIFQNENEAALAFSKLINLGVFTV